MRKTIFFLILLFVLFSLYSATSFAQNKTSPENYQELLQNYREYQGLIEPFNTQKSRHLAYQSVETQAEFLEASKYLLLSEVKTMTAYTAFIKSLLAEATQVLNYNESYLYVKLDDELAFLKIAKEKAVSLSSLGEASSLLTDLSLHYKNISRMSYQIKALIEVESTKKIVENLKVEREKLGNFFADNEDKKESSNQIFAAKEKFTDLDKEINAAGELIARADSKQKNFVSNEPKRLANEIQEDLNQALAKIKIVIAGYKNIVFSLK